MGNQFALRNVKFDSSSYTSRFQMKTAKDHHRNFSKNDMNTNSLCEPTMMQNVGNNE